LFSIIVTVSIAVVPPVASLFQVACLSVMHWLICVGLAIALVIVAELQKLISKGKREITA
jgi:hypothetical protein